MTMSDRTSSEAKGMATLVESEVQQRAQFALRSSPIHALRDIQVERNGERLILSGMVASFYLKQLAQEALRGITPGMRLMNEIVVDA
jgi:hypothetical protein